YTGDRIRWTAELLNPMAAGEELEVTADSIAVSAVRWEIPAEAQAGKYSGTLVFAAGEKKIEIPVSIEVATAPAAGRGEAVYGMYISEKQVPRIYGYIKSRDVRTATFPLAVRCEKDENGRIRIVMDEAIRALKEYFDAGMQAPIPLELTRLSSNLARLLGLYEKMPKDSTFDSRDLICPMSDEEMPAELLKSYEEAIREIHRQLKAAGFADKVLYYPVDEPTINAHRMYRARLEGSIIKRVVPGGKVFMTAHDIERVRRLAQAGALDVVCLAIGMLRHDNAEWAARFRSMAAENNLEIWTYGASYNENYISNAALGICVAQLQVRRMLLYVSYWDNVNVVDQLGDMRSRLKRCATFHPDKEGTGYVSTVQWEAAGYAARMLKYIGVYRGMIAEMDADGAGKANAELEERMLTFQDRSKVTLRQLADFQWWLFNKIRSR
ncbi:MAG: hypothetical protein J6S21_02990, partial [Victivallales bacterium]|nr:hypothetical protein [Victivallales bacterium]